MERLTVERKGCWELAAVGFGDTCDMVCKEHGSCLSCPITEAFNRLAEYENIGSVDEFKIAKEIYDAEHKKDPAGERDGMGDEHAG